MISVAAAATLRGTSSTASRVAMIASVAPSPPGKKRDRPGQRGQRVGEGRREQRHAGPAQSRKDQVEGHALAEPRQHTQQRARHERAHAKQAHEHARRLLRALGGPLAGEARREPGAETFGQARRQRQQRHEHDHRRESDGEDDAARGVASYAHAGQQQDGHQVGEALVDHHGNGARVRRPDLALEHEALEELADLAGRDRHGQAAEEDPEAAARRHADLDDAQVQLPAEEAHHVVREGQRQDGDQIEVVEAAQRFGELLRPGVHAEGEDHRDGQDDRDDDLPVQQRAAQRGAFVRTQGAVLSGADTVRRRPAACIIVDTMVVRFFSARRMHIVDVIVVLMVLFWVLSGIWVAREIRKVAGLTDPVVNTATNLRETTDALDALSGIPFVGGSIGSVVDQVQATTALAESEAKATREAIDRVATYTGLTLALVPTGFLLLLYLPPRLRWRREVVALRTVLARDPNSRVVARYLALQAVADLPFSKVIALSGDPWDEIGAGEFGGLATAELARLGIKRPAGPAPGAGQLPAAGQGALPPV